MFKIEVYELTFAMSSNYAFVSLLNSKNVFWLLLQITSKFIRR